MPCLLCPQRQSPHAQRPQPHTALCPAAAAALVTLHTTSRSSALREQLARRGAGPSAKALPEAWVAAPASEAAGRRGLRLARRGGPLEGQAERVAVGVVVLRAHARALGRVHHDVVPARQGGVSAGAKPYPGRRERGGSTLPCPGAQHVDVCCRLLCWCW